MTLDKFEQDFNSSTSYEAKRELLDQLMASDIDFSISENKERFKEYMEQAKDFKDELKREKDSLINQDIDDGKFQLYTCIKTSDNFTSGKNYYVKIDDLSKLYSDTQIGDLNKDLSDYIKSVKPLVWIVLDDGIGTLKRKELFDFDEFDSNFTKTIL